MQEASHKFGDFELDSARFELRRKGRIVKLERIPMELLVLLLEKGGAVVSRQEIVDRLWGKQVFVDTEHGINVAVRKIRKALRDNAEKPKFVQTVLGKGYRFSGELIEDAEVEAEAVPVAQQVGAPAARRPSWRFVAAAAVVLGLLGLLLGLNVFGIGSRFGLTQGSAIAAKTSVNPEAHDEYLHARYLLGMETAQMDKAIPHLERAVKIDPSYVPAIAALGEAWALEGVYGYSKNRETAPKAISYSLRAIALDPKSSEAYSAYGIALLQARRWKEAEAALRHAIELNPDGAQPHEYLSMLLMMRGRSKESLSEMREVALANPVSVRLQRVYANLLLRSGDLEGAITRCRIVIEMDPTHRMAYYTLGNALVAEGRYDEAEKAYRTMNPEAYEIFAWLAAKQGHTTRARQLLKRNVNNPSVYTAATYYLLGDRGTAFAQLDKLANDDWVVNTYWMRVDSLFDPMRSDARFAAIMKKTGLMDE